MGTFESAADARKKFGHTIGDTATSPPPSTAIPDYTNAEFFTIGKGSTPHPTAAIRRGLILEPGGAFPKAALAWETRNDAGQLTGQFVQCKKLVNGSVYDVANVWQPLGGSLSAAIVQDLTGGASATQVLSIAGLIAELDKKVDKAIPAPGANISVTNPVRRFGDAVAVTVTYSVAATAKPITGIALNGGPRPVIQSGTVNLNANTPADTDTNYQLYVTTGSESATVNASVVYRHERFWFVSNLDLFALSDADVTTVVLAQAGEFATGREQSRVFACAQQFIYFVWPDSFGAGSFVQNGLPSTAFPSKPFQFTNASGYTETARLTRSLSQQGGSQSVTVN